MEAFFRALFSELDLSGGGTTDAYLHGLLLQTFSQFGGRRHHLLFPALRRSLADRLDVP